MHHKYNKWVFIWLWIGLIMVALQVLIGGITRITESGLSITEWKPLSGAVFPKNQAEWRDLFIQYQQIDQYKIHFNQNLSITEFKYLYFWEWFHRNWARFIGVIFLVPYLLFSILKIFTKQQMFRYAWLFVVGALQGLAGWLMVASGLKEGNVFVEPLFLAIHFALALLTLALIFIFLWELYNPKITLESSVISPKLPLILLGILVVQFTFGAFLAGLHAAKAAPTFPDINGAYLPDSMMNISPFWRNFMENPIMIHFIHRGLAYVLFLFAIIWVYKFRQTSWDLRKKAYFYPILILLQILLGVFILLYAREQQDYKIMLVFASLHQGIAMLLFLYSLFMFRYLGKIKLA